MLRKRFKKDHISGTYQVFDVPTGQAMDSYNDCDSLKDSSSQRQPHAVQYCSTFQSKSSNITHQKEWEPSLASYSGPSLSCSESLDTSSEFSSYCNDSDRLNNDFEENIGSTINVNDVKEHSFHYKISPGQDIGLSEPNLNTNPPNNESINISDVNWFSQVDAVNSSVRYLGNQVEMQNFCELLYSEHLLKDFISLITMLISGQIPLSDIAFLCCMERSRFEGLESSTLMRFSPYTKDFWATIMRVGRGRVMDLLAGRKSAGNVINGKEVKGIFNPRNASVNFVIPSKDILSNHQAKIPNIIKPGIIYETFDMLDLSKQHIIMFDGKKIAAGLGEFPVGDVNLLGCEGSPTIAEKKENHESDLQLCERLDVLLQEDEANNNDDNKTRMQPLINQMIVSFSEGIQQVQNVIAKSHRQVKKLSSYVDVRMPHRYDFAIANEQGRIYMGQQWLDNTSEHVKELLLILSCLHSSEKFSRLENDVQLSTCGNYRPLHSVEAILRCPQIKLNPSIIRQRSLTWFEMRENAVVSGSSAWSGLGLRGVAALRKHYKQYIEHSIQSQSSSSTETDRMKHGNDNEVHAIATCISTFMPAFLPPCYVFREQGSYFLDGNTRADMLCVSPDGLLVCQYNENNESRKLSHARHKPIVVEIKCPFPDKGCIPVHYKVPIYYSLQVILEMFATSTETCWYISYSKDWTTLIKVTRDEALSDTVLQAIKDVFDHADVVLDRTLPDRMQFLKPRLQQFLSNNSTFVSISPSRTAQQHVCRCQQITSAYHLTDNNDPQIDNETHIRLLGCVATSRQLYTEGFQLLREKGQEIIAGIICDANRGYNASIPSNMPVVYGLKGYSLTVDGMRKFVDKTRQACFEEGVKVLCEAFDGQWCQLVFKDAANNPLTRFQLQKNCWNNSKKLGKTRLLEYFKEISSVAEPDLLSWSTTTFTTIGCLCFGNLQVEKSTSTTGHNNKLYLSTPGWEEDNLNDIEIIQSPRQFIYSKAPAYNFKFTPSGKRSVTEDLDINDIIQFLPEYVWPEDCSVDSDKSRESALDFSRVSGRSSFSVDVGDDAHTQPDILKQILEELKKTKYHNKYAQMNERQLYYSCLVSSETIGKEMTVIELNAVNSAILNVTGKSVFSKSELKAVKVNKLGKVFGDSETWFPTSRRKKSARPLKCIVEQYMKSTAYPKIILSCAHASIMYSKKELSWEHSSPLPMELRLKGESEPFEMFCYPELNQQRAQLEPRIIDPSHILNNVRAKICRSGIDAFTKATLKKLADCKDPYVESLMLNQLLDQQNTELSLRFFSRHVEDILSNLGCHDAAEFVRVFRCWFWACDSRGIDPVERIKMLIQMHQYLMDDYEFHYFPPPGRYFRGIPVQTVEAILHNISMRMLLYLISEDGTVNHRALATLGVECFYSLLAWMDYSGLQCPKATQLQYLLSHVIKLNHSICNPDRKFDVQGKKASKYPKESLERQLEVQRVNDDDIFRTNLFDIPKPGDNSQRIKVAKTHNSVFGQEVGVHGLRRYYKPDTSRFTIFDKLGIDPSAIPK